MVAITPQRAFIDRRQARRRHGVTLIETVAAIVILAIAIPPMLWAISNAHSQRVGPVQASTARWLAAEQLERIIADRHSPHRGYDYAVGANYMSEQPVQGFPGYSRSVTIAETSADLVTPGTGYKVVTVTVSYAGGSGEAQSHALSTVLTEIDS